MIDCCDHLKDWKHNVSEILLKFDTENYKDLYQIIVQIVCHAAMQCVTGSSSVKRKNFRQGIYYIRLDRRGWVK